MFEEEGTIGKTVLVLPGISCWSLLCVGSLFLHGQALSPLCSIIYCLCRNWSDSPDDVAGRATGRSDENEGLASPEGLVLRPYIKVFCQVVSSC